MDDQTIKPLPLRNLIPYLCLFLLLISLFFMRCANPVTPQGGPKDTDPPKVISCSPANFSTRFTGTEIRITFNEFVQLSSTTKEVIVSPPLWKKPELKLRGKTVVILFEDSLKPETTYIIHFGKAISDITENNPIADYMFVFSTGDAIDSLQIRGSVSDAFTNKPEPGVFVGLYTDTNDSVSFDSLPYSIPPWYVARTDDNGHFSLVHLASGQYKVFALNDKTGDLIFNTSDERIAFSDSLITSGYFSVKKTDSISSDTTEPEQTPPLIPLRMFEEIDSTQEVLKAKLMKNDQFMLVFKYPVTDLLIEPIKPDSLQEWIREINSRRDTLFLWTMGSLPDTLGLILHDNGLCLDTVYIWPTLEKTEKPKKKETDPPVPPPSLTIRWKPDKGVFNHFKGPLTGILSYPAGYVQQKPVILITGKDTITLPPVEFTDSIQRTFTVNYPWQENTTYTLLIPDSLITSYNGLSHDTVIHSVKTATARELGSLALQIKLPREGDHYIVQLQNEQGTSTLEESVLTGSGKVRFPYIKPGKYQIKAILDKNKNGHWDTGSYHKFIQPETVFFFPLLIDIRGNWDVEEDWIIQ